MSTPISWSNGTQSNHVQTNQNASQLNPNLQEIADRLVSIAMESFSEVCVDQINQNTETFDESKHVSIELFNDESNYVMFSLFTKGEKPAYFRISKNLLNLSRFEETEALIDQLNRSEKLIFETAYNAYVYGINDLSFEDRMAYKLLCSFEGIKCITESRYIKYGLLHIIYGTSQNTDLPIELFAASEQFWQPNYFPKIGSAAHKNVCSMCKDVKFVIPTKPEDIEKVVNKFSDCLENARGTDSSKKSKKKCLKTIRDGCLIQ